MTTVVQTKCDYCGTDLSDSGRSPDYRLVLSHEPVPTTSPVVFDIGVLPPFEGSTKHFCGFKCLVKWLPAEEL